MQQQQFAFFSLLLLLVTVFITSNSPVEGSLLERIHDRLVERSRAFIHKLLLGDLEHNPNETIVDKHFPDSGDLLRSQSPELDKCYSAAVVDGVRMSIFEHPIGKIIHEFLHAKNLTHSGGHSDETVASKVKNVLRSLKSIAHNVHNCIHRLNETSFKPTQFGLTHFATMSSEDIAAIYQQPLKTNKRSKGKKNNVTANSTATGGGGHAALGSSGGGSGGSDGPAALGSQEKPQLGQHFQITPEEYSREYPPTHDYRDQGVVSEVKDQGGCGFCFAFGAVGAMESSLMLHNSQGGVTLSEMDLIDCMAAHTMYTPSENEQYHVTDCEASGSVIKAFTEASMVGMTPTDRARPYVAHIEKWEPYPYQRERCGTDPVIARVSEYFYFVNVQDNDEQRLKAVLIKYGPVAVFLRTHLLMDTPENPHNFFSLHERDNLECDASVKTSHVMLLVGWDEEYWIIKNSYGNSQTERNKNSWEKPWGVDGYLYLGKEVATSCGLFGKESSWYFPSLEVSQEGGGGENGGGGGEYDVQPSYKQGESSNGGGGGGMYGGGGAGGYSYSQQPFWAYSAASYPQLQNSEAQRAALYPWLQNPSYDWSNPVPANPESSFVFGQMADLAEQEEQEEDWSANFQADNQNYENYYYGGQGGGGGGGGYPWYG